MFPTYQPNDNVIISNDTIEGINKLYGQKVQPVPEDNSSAIGLIKAVFKNKKEMNRLYEREIVEMANYVGIDAKTSDRKSDTISKILNLIADGV